MLLKQKHPSLLRNLVLGTFGKLLIVFSTMVNLLYIPPLFNDPEVLSSASDKAKLFAKNFSKNSNLDDLGISLPVFSSISNLNLHNIFITHEMVKKVLTNLCSSKASGPDCNNNRSGVLIQLMHPRRSTEFGKLVLFTSLGLVEFQVRNLALFLLFSVIGGFWWFWMGWEVFTRISSSCWSSSKVQFLVLHFSFCTLMTFLMMLSVIFLSMLIILLSALNAIGHLICGNN